MISCVYLIYNKINGKLYVGKSCEYERRWQRHINVARGGKEKYPTSFSTIHAAMNKYGIENFAFKIIENNLSEQESLLREKDWIILLRQLGYILYNMTDGGEGSSGYKHTPEAIIKMQGRSGINNPRFRIKHSQESIKKMSISKLADSAHNSELNRGENNPNSKLSKEDIFKIKELLSQGVTQVNIAKKFGVNQCHISRIKLQQSWKDV